MGEQTKGQEQQGSRWKETTSAGKDTAMGKANGESNVCLGYRQATPGRSDKHRCSMSCSNPRQAQRKEPDSSP